MSNMNITTKFLYSVGTDKSKGLAMISYIKFHFLDTCWYIRIFRDPSHVVIYT